MAITFTQDKKKQRYLLIILGLLVLLIFSVVWWSFSARKVPPAAVEPAIVLPKVTVDFDALKSLALEELQVFTDVPAFQGEIGRNNPFIPY